MMGSGQPEYAEILTKAEAQYKVKKFSKVGCISMVYVNWSGGLTLENFPRF